MSTAPRRIALRTRGHGHGPITRLMSPSDLGQVVKPFVFLDIFDIHAIASQPASQGMATRTRKRIGGTAYAECSELYSATDRLGVHEELDTYLASLTGQGICLAAATRGTMLRSQPSVSGVRMDILYVVAFPRDAVPESFAVERQIRLR